MDYLLYSMLAFATLMFLFMVVGFTFLAVVILRAIQEYRNASKNERMLAAGLVMVLTAVKAVWKK